MIKPNTKKDLTIACSISLILLILLFAAKQYPVQSYTGSRLCGEVEKYTVLSGEVSDYSRIVNFYKNNERPVEITDGIVDAAKACPQGGEISLYLI